MDTDQFSSHHSEFPLSNNALGETKKVSNIFWKQLLGLDKEKSNRKHFESVQVSSDEKTHFRHRRETFFDIRAFDKKQEQLLLKKRIDEVNKELQVLAKTIPSREGQLAQATSPIIGEAGIYHVTFLEGILETLRDIQIHTEDADIWKFTIEKKKRKRVAVS